MEISTSTIGEHVQIQLLKLEGDFSNGNHLVDAVQVAIDAGQKYVLVDLSQVRFISSSGLRGIHAAFELLNTANTADSDAIPGQIATGSYKSPYIKLLNPTDYGLRSLRMGGFDMFIDIFSQEADAIASF